MTNLTTLQQEVLNFVKTLPGVSTAGVSQHMRSTGFWPEKTIEEVFFSTFNVLSGLHEDGFLLKEIITIGNLREVTWSAANSEDELKTEDEEMETPADYQAVEPDDAPFTIRRIFEMRARIPSSEMLVCINADKIDQIIYIEQDVETEWYMTIPETRHYIEMLQNAIDSIA